MELRTVAQLTDAGCMEGSGDGFLGVPLDLLTVIIEGNLLSTVKFQNGVFRKSHSFSSLIRFLCRFSSLPP